MKKPTAIAVCLLGVAGVYWLAQAGDLEPPGDPGSTMATLQQIYDKMDDCTGGGLCGVPTTGQTECWDAVGTLIDCTGTGQDGDYQAGASLNPRFTDNGNGTVTDNLTGLIWLQDADCFGQREWSNALSDANTLASDSDTCTPDLSDGSVAGDWRLPNVKELQSLIDYGEYGPALPSGHPFSGVLSTYYWSSTSNVYYPINAWYVNLNIGFVHSSYPKTNTYYVWPVRGGL